MLGSVTFYISFGLITVEFLLHLFSDTAAIVPDEDPPHGAVEEKTLLLGDFKKKEEFVVDKDKPSKVK